MTTLEQKAISVVGCRRENPQCLNCVDFDCKRELTGFKKGYAEALRWRDVNIELPPIDKEVIAKSAKWIDEDFNPRGIRVGFMTDHGFISAKWVDYHNCYIEKRSEDNTNEMPTHWRPVETI